MESASLLDDVSSHCGEPEGTREPARPCATTLLDGATAGKTTVSLTPGVRFWFLPQHSLTLGVDVPVSHAPTFHTAVRATYIQNF